MAVTEYLLDELGQRGTPDHPTPLRSAIDCLWGLVPQFPKQLTPLHFLEFAIKSLSFTR